MKVRKFLPEDNESWDLFCESSNNGSTFLHTRKFLSYHKEKFEDLSVIVEDDSGACIGIFPAAKLSGVDDGVVVSHPGATYGGLLHAGKLSGDRMITAMYAICSFYRDLDFREIIYKAVPHIYHSTPAQDDLYALFRLGAKRIRSDLSASVNLKNRGEISQRRKRAYKKALKNGVEIITGKEIAPELWLILSDNLEKKYGAMPVHSIREIQLLCDIFPNEVEFIGAVCDGSLVAGVVLFNNSMVSHAQYIASSEKGYSVSALDFVFEYCIKMAESRKSQYFDFGTSNEDQGKILNESLYKFKVEFGAGGTVHEYYKLDIMELKNDY